MPDQVAAAAQLADQAFGIVLRIVWAAGIGRTSVPRSVRNDELPATLRELFLRPEMTGAANLAALGTAMHHQDQRS